MPTYDVSNRLTTIARDVAAFSCTPAPEGGTGGTAVSFIGIFESVEISLKREFVDTTGAADVATTSRALRWGKGSVKITGFNRGTASKLAAMFAVCSHNIFQFQENATGDQYQLMCTSEDFFEITGEIGYEQGYAQFGARIGSLFLVQLEPLSWL